MSFASFAFAIFFPVVLCGTLFAERRLNARAREVFLLAASYFFYGYWDWRFCFLLLFVTAISFWSAQHTENKTVFTIGVVTPLVVLAFFKYFNFFLASASMVIGRELGALRIILPVGISFYTFQALSYVIDVHRGRIPVEKSFVKLALYVSFFPQLVAGPIVRASDFLPQLYEDRRITWPRVQEGLQIMALGLFKKIVLADHLSVFVNDIFARPSAFHWTTLLLCTTSYYLQIYFDFSGYSDLAIGCARCFGYDFKRNFNFPFLSQNVTEFWARWHISLSTWLKEYLYIPLGGNRRGKHRQQLNLFLTMLLGGLWHGANWTFVFWGGLNGLVLILEKKLPPLPEKYQTVPVQALRVAKHLLFMALTVIFFRADSFSVSWSVLSGIVTLQNGIRQPFMWAFVALVVFVVSTAVVVRRSGEKDWRRAEGFYPMLRLDTVFGLTVFFFVVGLTFALAYTGDQPFVYFQF